MVANRELWLTKNTEMIKEKIGEKYPDKEFIPIFNSIDCNTTYENKIIPELISHEVIDHANYMEIVEKKMSDVDHKKYKYYTFKTIANYNIADSKTVDMEKSNYLVFFNYGM